MPYTTYCLQVKFSLKMSLIMSLIIVLFYWITCF
jgi:hypothetical protein